MTVDLEIHYADFCGKTEKNSPRLWSQLRPGMFSSAFAEEHEAVFE
jgi:hypothetical protein